MKRAMCLSISLLLALAVSIVHGYSKDTHRRFSDIAFSKSLATISPPFMEISLDEARQLVEDGSADEDGGILRPLNVFTHFVDPQQGNLQLLGIPGIPNSPDWALEDNGDQVLLGNPFYPNDYSYKHARDYYLQGLTALEPTTRQDKQREMYKALGHVIHHIQDIGQPQHVRNDIHCSDPIVCGTLELATGLDILEPSEFESYSDGFLTVQKIAELYSNSIYGGTGHRFFFATSLLLPAGIRTPRDFLVGSLGMATFTSNNFLSVDTNYVDSVSVPLSSIFQIDPDPQSPHSQPNAGAAAPLFQRSFSGPQVTGNMYFFRNSVSDGFTQQTFQIDEFSTFSVFDDELVRNGFDPLLAQNRFTFEATYPVLVPRIVAFSAGLLDYFFRGRIAVQALSALQYRVVNNSSEAMTNGKLHLVIEDAQGRRNIEQTYLNVTIAANGGFYPIGIDFNQVAANLDPPLSGIARAFFVYEGSLGLETRAIAVSLAPVLFPSPPGGCSLQVPTNVTGQLVAACEEYQGSPFWSRYTITWVDTCQARQSTTKYGFHSLSELRSTL